MSRTKGLEHVLFKARLHEKALDWISAADSYEAASIVALESGGPRKAAEFSERAGLLYRLSAMQSDARDDFVERMKSAVEAYQKAVRLYEEAEGEGARKWKSQAMASLANYWLASSPAQKQELMAEFTRLKTRVLEHYDHAKNEREHGKAFNDLLMCICESDSDRCSLEWNYLRREKALTDDLRLGEKVIATFSNLKDDHELAKTYLVTGKLYEMARHICKSEDDKKQFGQKGSSYLQSAADLSKKVGDGRLFCLTSIWLGIATVDWTGNMEESLEHFGRALCQAKELKDNYLKGHALHGLAYGYHWKCTLELDTERRKEFLRRAAASEDSAWHQFRIFSFVPLSFWILPDSYSSLAQEETDYKERCALLERAVRVAREILSYAEASGYFPRPDWGVYHGLSKAIYYLASVETKPARKKQLYEESLKHRQESIRIVEKTTPFDYWSRGVFRNYLAILSAELAYIDFDKTKKHRLLEEAVQNMEKSLEFCSKRLEISPKASLYVTVGRYHENYATILTQLYSLTNDAENLKKAIKVYEGAAEAFGNAGWPSRVAEAYWQIAALHDRLGQYLESAKSFESASENYQSAAQELVQLKEFFSSHALYMQAWVEIERARHFHEAEEFAQSRVHYQKAAELCASTKSWEYMAPNYSAWSQLEKAEDLSRAEKSEEAVQAFQETIQLFGKAKKSLEEAISRIESQAEKKNADELSKASDVRSEYCIGRTYLEQARIYDHENNTKLSADKYRMAAQVFQSVMRELGTEPEREELVPIVYSCQAWEKMKLAEQKASPDLFHQSSKLFEKAKEHCSNEKASVLAMGNSALCRALEAVNKFDSTGSLSFYSVAKRNMESSASFYLKAGFEKASAWVGANEALLDAYAYMSMAETEIAHEKKVELFQLAEKYLERSLFLYQRTGYKGKVGEISKILAKAREKRAFALSLSEALRAPLVASSTSIISVPSQTHEEAIGLEKFQHTNIQAHLSVPSEVTVGETFEVRLDMANVAKEPGLIVRIENLATSGLSITEITPRYGWNGVSIDLKGRRLEPQKLESVRILAKGLESGVIHLNPKIVYVDDLGKFKLCQPDPATIAVYPPGKFQFQTDKAQQVFEYLAKAFVEDYMKRKLTQEKSGWRTLMQIVENARTSKTSVYGTGAHRGTAISELQSRGVVDLRIFTEERGRGGKITKARIAYEKDIVKRHVDQQVMKIKEK